jgi:DNA-binding response OmpR family regulator
MKILIIDDEDLIRRSLKRVFEREKFSVQEAENGLDGLKLWRECQPDLVVLDVLMPGLTGPQVLKEIGTEKNAKVILISAYTGEYDLNKAHEMGADLFITKPFQGVFEVVQSARELLGQK